MQGLAPDYSCDPEFFLVPRRLCGFIAIVLAMSHGFLAMIFCFLKKKDIFVTYLRHCGNGRASFKAYMSCWLEKHYSIIYGFL